MVLQSNIATKRSVVKVSNLENKPLTAPSFCLPRRKQSSALLRHKARLNKQPLRRTIGQPRVLALKKHQPATSAPPDSVSLKLPKELQRPVLPEITRQALEAVDVSLKDVDVAYLREQLEAVGPDFYKTLCHVQSPSSSSSSLPKELDITVLDREPSSVFPTHVLAIFGPDHQKTNSVKLHPIHSLYLAAHCSRLPPLPSSPPFSQPHLTQGGDMTSTIPVVPLRLPSPATYKPLFHYLYTKRSDVLLSSLLPLVPSDILASLLASSSDPEHRQRIAEHLASVYAPQLLLQHLLVHVHGLYLNAGVLGVVDAKLWEVLGCAWEVMLAAFKMGSA